MCSGYTTGSLRHSAAGSRGKAALPGGGLNQYTAVAAGQAASKRFKAAAARRTTPPGGVAAAAVFPAHLTHGGKGRESGCEGRCGGKAQRVGQLQKFFQRKRLLCLDIPAKFCMIVYIYNMQIKH